MGWRDDLRTTGTALKHWLIAMCYYALCVAVLWYVGLRIIGIALSWLWAPLGGLLQFISTFGPAFTAAIVSGFEDFTRFFYVLILFAAVMVVDGLFLQPYLMKRTAKVPFWASLVTPIVLGIIIPFWGVLLAPPLLAIIYAFRQRRQSVRPDS